MFLEVRKNIVALRTRLSIFVMIVSRDENYYNERTLETLQQEIKQLIIDALGLEDITPDDIAAEEALFGDGLGLDSIDALELGVAIKQKYQINIKGEDENAVKKHFYSVATLAQFIAGHEA